MSVLSLTDVRVEIGAAAILRGVSLSVSPGETLGIVGESGCGKSMTALTAMGMLPRGATVSGSLVIDGREAIGFSEKEWLAVRGQVVSLVTQDPFTSLNPVMRVGEQVAEVYRVHHGTARRAAWDLAVEMLGKVGLPSPALAAKKFPHQMSGGQRQRVVIAAAFASRPKVLIADEPTTALDVTIQGQVLRLIKDMQRDFGTAVILISHDIGVIGSVSDRVAVFYPGRVVETGPTSAVLAEPRHPYTKALLEAVPRPGVSRLKTISGQPPRLDSLPVGCSFSPRCPSVFERCRVEDPVEIADGDKKCSCWLQVNADGGSETRSEPHRI